MSQRASALADRLEEGARALGEFAEGLSDAEWRMAMPNDGRTIGVVVHHVASIYPLEIELAQTVASGKPITGVTWNDVAKVNADHAHAHKAAGKAETLDLLRRNSKAAADAIRSLSDEQLDSAAPISLNADAPLTAQFFVEDHAVRHSFHHLSRIRAVVGR
jgi:hypothetical protein